MTSALRILVLGTADWDQSIATNQHNVVRQLCQADGNEVTFVESTGLRRPQLTWRDVRRISRRVLRRNRAMQSGGWRARPEGLSVISPVVIPWHRGPAKVINRLLLRYFVRGWIRENGAPKVLWTYTPSTYGLQREAAATVYHCVDLLARVPGIDPVVIARGEKELASHGATAIATSQVVASHLRTAGFDSPLLWENVADTSVVSSARSLHLPRDPGTAIFAGNLAPNKIDYALLERLAATGVRVRLAGPRAEGGGRDEEQFHSLIESGVEYLGLLTIEELARELVKATVGLIPYVLNDYTRGVSPLKTFEYLAAGLPVVSTALPGVHEISGDVYVEATVEEFVERVLAVPSTPAATDVVRRTTLAEGHSWAKRGELIRELVSSAVECQR